MRIKRFTRSIRNIFAQSKHKTRAELVQERTDPELHNAIRALEVPEIQKMLKSFITPDLLALMNRVAGNKLNAAFQGLVMSRIKSVGQLKRWAVELNQGRENPPPEILETMTGETVMDLLSGVYGDVLTNGKATTKFQLPKLMESLPGSEIAMPHCPTCKALDLKTPLSTMDISSGKLEIDNQVQCKRNVDLKTLTSEQNKILKSQESSGRVVNWELGFSPCPYKLPRRLPNMTRVIEFSAMAAVGKMMEQYRTQNLAACTNKGKPKMTRFYALKRLVEDYVQDNKNTKPTEEEVAELQKLSIWMTDHQYVRVEDLDSTRGNGDEGRLVGEDIADTRQIEREELDRNTYVLKEFLDEADYGTDNKSFSFLDGIAKSTPLIKLIGLMYPFWNNFMTPVKELQDPSALDSDEQQAFREILQEANRAIGLSQTDENSCLSCGSAEINTQARDGSIQTITFDSSTQFCPHGPRMLQKVQKAYEESSDYESYLNSIQSLSNEESAHYDAASLATVAQQVFPVVSEEDLQKEKQDFADIDGDEFDI